MKIPHSASYEWYSQQESQVGGKERSLPAWSPLGLGGRRQWQLPAAMPGHLLRGVWTRAVPVWDQAGDFPTNFYHLIKGEQREKK